MSDIRIVPGNRRWEAYPQGAHKPKTGGRRESSLKMNTGWHQSSTKPNSAGETQKRYSPSTPNVIVFV